MTDEAGGRLRALYVLLLLSLLSLINMYDRSLVSILVEPLKADFHLSDTQLGLLSGPAFAIVYSVFLIPIARYADRGRRTRVLGIAALLWSAMAGLCGMATAFPALLAARLGVGLGEAGAAPTTQAIIAETFAPDKRGRAFAIIALAGSLGAIAAAGGGGYLAFYYGWRTAFFAGAIPGIALGILLLLTVRDSGTAGVDPTVSPSIRARDGLIELGRRKAFVWACIGGAVASIGAGAGHAWLPTFFMRRFSLTSAELGGGYSLALGSAMIIGILVGGLVNDYLVKRGDRSTFFLIAFSYAVTAPLTLLVLTAGSYTVALVCLFAMMLLGGIYIGPVFALIQSLTGVRLRATGAAIFLLSQTLVGSVGPLIVGWLSDYFASRFGAESLKIALIISLSTYIVGALCFPIASRTGRKDMTDADGLGTFGTEDKLAHPLVAKPARDIG
jgi:MFS family permease